MSAEGAFRISVVGTEDDVARLQASTAQAADRYLFERAHPAHIEAMASRSPDVAVIGADVERPLPIARQIRIASPQSQILFLLQSDRLDRFRATLPFVPNLASAWTASTASDPSSMAKVLGEAARAARHRAATETMLGRINRQLAAGAAQPAEVRRSQLVLTERYLATILTQSPDGFFAVDPSGAVIACNDAAVALLGSAVEEGNILEAEPLGPEERDRLKQLIARATAGDTAVGEVELNRDGETAKHLELSVAPIHDQDRAISSVSVTVRDITDRKRWERHQQLLIAELNHRVKNTLAIVQSLAHQTFTADKPPREAIKAYEGRLSALAAAHNLLTRENWEAAALGDVVAQALNPFCRATDCTFDGPDVRVPPRVAVSLTLALHELATNAQKYGSLSAPSGKVEVTWTVADEMLRLQWVEKGGPPAKEPETTGFGTRMLKRALAADLNGRVELQYGPDGVLCRIRAPLESGD